MKNLVKIFGLLWISHSVYADGLGQAPHNKEASTHYGMHQSPRFEASVLVGGSYIPNTIEGQSLALLPYEIGPYADTFTDQSDAGAFNWGVDAKYRFKLHKPSAQHYIFDSIGAGIGVFQITSFDQTGNVLQFNMPEFENYTYNLNLKTTRIMADFDVDFIGIQHFIPFIEGGIGAASTTVSYDSEPIPPISGPDFTLHDKTSWNFAYQVGAGVKYVIDTHFILSLHYLYANMGKVDSSTSGSTTDLAAPLTVDMSTQNFLFGFTYAM
ncbi:MAG: outer membrane protein [Gammaproteobacteria bacterium]